MKKPKEYLKELFEEPFNLEEGNIENDFLKIIKQVQIDAIDKTCRVCADNAEAEEGYIGYSWEIDKESILSVADKLKKELE